MLGGNDMRVSGPVVAKPQQHGSSRASNIAPVCRSDIHPMRRGGAKSFVDDLGLGRGVVLSRAAASLRSIETKPFDSEICLLCTDTSLHRGVFWLFVFSTLLFFFSKDRPFLVY